MIVVGILALVGNCFVYKHATKYICLSFHVLIILFMSEHNFAKITQPRYRYTITHPGISWHKRGFERSRKSSDCLSILMSKRNFIHLLVSASYLFDFNIGSFLVYCNLWVLDFHGLGCSFLRIMLKLQSFFPRKFLLWKLALIALMKRHVD